MEIGKVRFTQVCPWYGSLGAGTEMEMIEKNKMLTQLLMGPSSVILVLLNESKHYKAWISISAGIFLLAMEKGMGAFWGHVPLVFDYN